MHSDCKSLWKYQMCNIILIFDLNSDGGVNKEAVINL